MKNNYLLSTKNLAFQATAYEKWGTIDFERFKNNEILEVLDDLSESEIIELYNQYLQENDPDSEVFENGENFFNTFFENNPEGAVRATFYGNYRFMDPYVRFNGYGNLESLEEWTLSKEAIDNGDFLAWLFENADYIANANLVEFIEYLEANKDEIIDEALKLVKKGY